MDSPVFLSRLVSLTHGSFPTDQVDNAQLTWLTEPPDYATCTNIPAVDGMTYTVPHLEANDTPRRISRLRTVPRLFLKSSGL